MKKLIIYSGHDGKFRVCCTCKHNRRRNGKETSIENKCDIDGHFIGYIECFDNWCRHWALDSWQERKESR